MRTPMDVDAIVGRLWADAGMPADAPGRLALSGAEPVLPTAFRVAAAAQASLAAAALAADEVRRQRCGGRTQRIEVPMRDAALETLGWFAIDGRTPPAWDPLSGLYPCAPNADARSDRGWVRVHANFYHHRDRLLTLLGLPTGTGTTREQVAAALANRDAESVETDAAAAGAVVACLRPLARWLAHPQAAVVAAEPLLAIEPIDEARPAPPRDWPTLAPSQRPLEGLRVIDQTRILAGPVAGRLLAGYGADVMLINSPRLPNNEAIAATSLGKRSAQLDLDRPSERSAFEALVAQADVVLQAYRPGALAARGLAAEDLARLRPGVVAVSLSAWGTSGPWAGRRGFDSLVQTATGFNLDEAQAFGQAAPRPLPMQILDYAAGYLMAFGAQAAMLRQAREGGSWSVRVSLAGVGQWLRSLGRLPDGPAEPVPSFEDLKVGGPSGFGELAWLRHAVRFESTPAAWVRPSVPPGTDPPVWD